MVEPVTTHQLSMGIILVVIRTIMALITISNGANNYFRHQISSVQPTPTAKTSHMIILMHYFGALDMMKVVTNGLIGMVLESGKIKLVIIHLKRHAKVILLVAE